MDTDFTYIEECKNNTMLLSGYFVDVIKKLQSILPQIKLLNVNCVMHAMILNIIPYRVSGGPEIRYI